MRYGFRSSSSKSSNSPNVDEPVQGVVNAAAVANAHEMDEMEAPPSYQEAKRYTNLHAA